jgi:hypothetical protein
LDSPIRRYARALLPLWLSALVAMGALPGCAGGGGAHKSSSTKGRSQLRAVASETLSARADQDRQELIRQELERYTQIEVAFDAAKLPPADQQLLRTLVQAADEVATIELLQLNPNMLEYRQQVLEDGTDLDRRLFRRNHGPWCLSSADVRCNALRSMPPKVIGFHAWPEGFAASEVARIRAAADSKPLLSPFTIVRREGGELQARPLHADPVLGEHVKQLAQLLERAAEYAEAAPLAAYLQARAKDLLSAGAYPFAASLAKWEDVEGTWDVVVGPLWRYGSPYGIKARFGMLITRASAEADAQLESYRKQERLISRWINRLSRARLKPPSSGEQLDVRAVDVLMASGAARRPDGAPASYQPPEFVDNGTGTTKRLLLVNHVKARGRLLAQRAQAALAADHVSHVNSGAAVQNAVALSFCRSLAPNDTTPIETKKGKTTIGKALGSLGPVTEHVQARALALWLANERARRRQLTDEVLEDRYTTALVELLTTAQGDIDAPPVQAAAIILGELLVGRGVTFDKRSGKWTLSVRNMRRTAKKIASRVLQTRLTGDRTTAERTFATFFNREAGNLQLVDIVDNPRLRTKGAFLEADAKEPVLAYVVKNLPAPAQNTGKSATPADKKEKKAGPAAQDVAGTGTAEQAKKAPTDKPAVDHKKAKPKKARPAASNTKPKPKKVKPAGNDKEAGPGRPSSGKPKKSAPGDQDTPEK